MRETEIGVMPQDKGHHQDGGEARGKSPQALEMPCQHVGFRLQALRKKYISTILSQQVDASLSRYPKRNQYPCPIQ